MDLLGVDLTHHLESKEGARVMYTRCTSASACVHVRWHLWAGRHVRQVQQVVSPRRQMWIRDGEVNGRRERVPRHLHLRVVRGLLLAPAAAATRSDQTATRYRVDHVDLLSDGVVDGAGILFTHFHNNMLIHRPPAQ